ncbi:MAG: response regulator [Bdellovibrionales bacterium]|nr:response regulator [Bdellovibrionales bacterium]
MTEASAVRFRVLCVEDDEALLATYVSTLSDRFDVRGYTDSSSIPMEDFQWADVLLVDYNMPVKTGLDVMEEMYCMGFEKPVVFVTGHVSELLQGLQNFHVVEVLGKPASLNVISGLIETYAAFYQDLHDFQVSLFQADGLTRSDLDKRIKQFNAFKFSKLFNLRNRLNQQKRSAS